jgi:uncharacterized protein (TIGR03546 family)
MRLALMPIRMFARPLTAESSPRQLALGFAIGVAIGFVPKGNLTAVILMLILCATRVNLAAGFLGALIFSWVGSFADPVTHQMGLFLLQAELLVPLWTFLYDLPVMPWTSFNNTIVLGSLILGLALVWPAYRFSIPACERYVPPLTENLKSYKVVQLIWGADWMKTSGEQACAGAT